MDKEQVFATTKVQDFSSWQPKKQKKTKNKKILKFYKAHHHEHCILCMRSLRIPLYNAIRFSGIPLTVGVLFLQLISSLLNFMHSSLYSLPFPLGSFTSSANCTFFFFLSLFFSSTITTKKRQKHSVPLLTRKKEQRRTKEKEPMYQKASKNEEFSFQAVGNIDSWKVGVVG